VQQLIVACFATQPESRVPIKYENLTDPRRARPGGREGVMPLGQDEQQQQPQPFVIPPQMRMSRIVHAHSSFHVRGSMLMHNVFLYSSTTAFGAPGFPPDVCVRAYDVLGSLCCTDRSVAIS
jgi:hypothetical protein